MRIAEWTVDYGDGPRPVQVPHAWRQDVPLSWEGPALYQTRVDTTSGQGKPWLVFEGVSYEARVRLDGFEVAVHHGIWDAFAVPLPEDRASVLVEVEVTKNGGPRFPVREVASGFLPFVFGTFGGLFRPVRLVYSASDPTSGQAAAQARVRVEGTRLYGSLQGVPDAKSKAEAWLAARRGEAVNEGVGGEEPLYLRGVLTWGWYPEEGHPHPSLDSIQGEIDQCKKLGFNLIKFCLWMPPHEYLEAMERAGLWAWIELPIWDPSPDHLEPLAGEMRRLVRQYRHHPNIVAWTAGCELGRAIPARFRQELVEMIQAETGAPLVKDNSGGSEMYGGDLREFGTFADFHPYCETPFYPQVLDSLTHGPRRNVPILLGEFNDIDVHRDLSRLSEEALYWASDNPDLNVQGVRWQYDLPAVLAEPTAEEPGFSADSLSKAIFMRKFVQEEVRQREDIAGYVVTGWRDTPISTSGMVDDWGQSRFRPEDLAHWNGSTCLFRIATRRPPWVHGGNRPGWVDPFSVFPGRCFFRIGAHSERGETADFEWDILHFSWEGSQRPQGRVAKGSIEGITVEANSPVELGEISWETDRPGGYLLRVRFGEAENSWPLWVLPEPSSWEGWGVSKDLDGLYSGLGVSSFESDLREVSDGTHRILLLQDEATLPLPFWRESAYEFHDKAFWEHMGFRGHWERFLPLTPDRAIDLDALQRLHPGDWQVLMNRVDTRTYREHPILVQSGAVIATTLRPHGGLGVAPRGVVNNPSGRHFLERLKAWLVR